MPVTFIQSGRFGIPFAPDDIATISAWYDASDAATITDTGGSLTAWADKTANNFDLTPGSSNPVTGSSTQNGRNVIDFTTDYLQTAGNVQAIHATDGHFTAFAVAKATDATPTGGITTLDTSGARGPQLLRFSAEQVQTIRVQNNAGSTSVVTDSTAASVSDATFAVVASRLDASVLEAWLNGSSNGSTACTGGAREPTALQVGSASGGAEQLVGSIAEIIIYADDLTNSEMNDVGNYLASKWGLTWTNI